MPNNRLEMRIRRLQRRMARVQRWLDRMKTWDESKHHPIRAFLAEILHEDPDVTDEEIAEALVERVDEMMRFKGIMEIISDIGIRSFANIAVRVIRHRQELMTKRIETLQARISELQGQLEGPRAHARRALEDDTKKIFDDLGMDPQFVAEGIVRDMDRGERGA